MLDGARRNYQFSSQFPGGAGDMTLVELQEMATRQQHVVETQQQVLLAKEQRLKYLRQQEAHHAQLASESERLRKIRERVENQELKLKKLRTLRDQAEQYKINNGQLNSELEAVKTVFSEKEKELAMAVARVDQLTRQLRDLKNVPTNSKQAAADSELQKLRKELMMRNKLNEQQNNVIAAKEKLLNDRKEKVALMDVRIHKLQQRLKKRQLQERQVNLQNKITKLSNQQSGTTNVATADPITQQTPKEEVHPSTGGFIKHEPRYQILPSDIRPEPADDHILRRQDTKSVFVEEHKLPASSASNFNENAPRQNYSQPPPPPESSDKPSLVKDGTVEKNISKPGPGLYSVIKSTSAGSKFFPGSVSGVGQHQRPHAGTGDGPSNGVLYTALSGQSSTVPPPTVPPSTVLPPTVPPTPPPTVPPPLPPTLPPPLPPTVASSYPSISINDEERQAGSGQSSPASSESSPNSGGIGFTKNNSEEINTSSIGPVSALIEKLNKNVGQVQQTSAESMGLKRSHFTQKSHDTSVEGSGSSQISGRLLNSVPPVANKPSKTYFNQFVNTNPPSSTPRDEADILELSKDSLTTPPAGTSSEIPPVTNQTSSSGPHLNQKPALTYRYASKNTIANTYMGRLGSAAMEKYQRNLNLLYKSVDSQGNKDMPVAVEGTTPTATETPAVLPLSPSADTLSPGHNYPQFGAGITSPSYPDIASDKGSFKLHTPKQVRRRHSDSESEDLNKALQEQQDREQQQQQSLQLTENETLHDSKPDSESPLSSPSMDKSKQSPDKNITAKASPQKTADVKSPDSPSSVKQQSENVLLPPGVKKSSSSSKVDAVLKRSKSNLKKDSSRKSNNRVSFDPLALLLDASLEGELDLVKKVALQVEDVSTPNDEGITALHNAICAGHYDIVMVLVELGCDVNSPDSDGWTPLHCAASCNNLPMVRFLVEHGACVFATTISDHETAADKCEEDEEGYHGCSDYLYSIQEKMGIINGGEVYAVFDYQATNVDELSFQNGKMLKVMRKGDEKEKEWWWAQHNGKEGYIPRNLLGLYPRVVPKIKDTSEC